MMIKTIKFGMFATFILVLAASCEKSNGHIEQNTSTDSTETIEVIPSTVYNLDVNLMLKLVNDVRIKGCDCVDNVNNITDKMPPVSALVWSNQLADVALSHSEDMQKRNYFSHTTPEGVTFDQRISKSGYKFRAAGENIAHGQPTEESVVAAWLKSYGHCKSIMNGNFKEMGVGRSKVENYWTQLFAAK